MVAFQLKSKFARSTMLAYCLALGWMSLGVDVVFAQTTWWVDASHTGGNGSQTNPFTTINQAANAAVAGDTIYIQPGTYRESINNLTKSNLTIEGVNTTMSNRAVLSGSDVLAGWSRPDPSVPIYRVPWTIPVGSRYATFTDGAGNIYLDGSNPLAYREQLFVNGLPMRQVLSHNDLTPGTFYINTSDPNQAYVETRITTVDRNPNNATMEIAARETAIAPRIDAPAAGVTIRNITVQNHAGKFQGSILRTSDNWTVDNVTLQWNEGGALNVKGDSATVNNVVSQFNGALGIAGNTNTNAVVRYSVSRGNNIKGYDPDIEAGGGKWVYSAGATFDHYTATDNIGPGLWFDVSNTGVTVRNSTFANQRPLDPAAPEQGRGLVLEIVNGTDITILQPNLITGNMFSDNIGPGLGIWESKNVQVTDNLFLDNALHLRAIDRSQAILGDVSIENNQFKISEPIGLNNYAIQTTNHTTLTNDPADAQIFADYNAYNAGSGVGLIRWKNTYYSDLAGIRESVSQGGLGWEAHGSTATINGSSDNHRFGDFDHDQLLTNRDIDLLFHHIRQSRAYRSDYDLNQDGVVNSMDTDWLVRGVMRTEFGDANLDGVVNTTDQQAVQNNWNKPGTWRTGDFDGNGVTDGKNLQTNTILYDWTIVNGNTGFNTGVTHGLYPVLADGVIGNTNYKLSADHHDANTQQLSIGGVPQSPAAPKDESSVAARVGISAYGSGSDKQTRSYVVAFLLPVLASNETITQATLAVRFGFLTLDGSGQNINYNVDLYALGQTSEDPGVIADVHWASTEIDTRFGNQLLMDNWIISTTPAGTTMEYSDAALFDFLNQMIAAGHAGEYVFFRLSPDRGFDATGGYYNFNTQDHVTANFRPSLTIDVGNVTLLPIPEPSTFSLICLMGLFIRRRHRH
ncbi:MAG: right-handed parallel beta-helix repeat-containing protein [Phycisphaerales bacterium]